MHSCPAAINRHYHSQLADLCTAALQLSIDITTVNLLTYAQLPCSYQWTLPQSTTATFHLSAINSVKDMTYVRSPRESCVCLHTYIISYKHSMFVCVAISTIHN